MVGWVRLTRSGSGAGQASAAGQVLGKGWMVLAALPFIAWLRRRDERLGVTPA